MIAQEKQHKAVSSKTAALIEGKETQTEATNNQESGKIWIAELPKSVVDAFEKRFKNAMITDATLDEQGFYHVTFKRQEGGTGYEYFTKNGQKTK